jgi:PIN domain nuclease of toxin-antitoxin system
VIVADTCVVIWLAKDPDALSPAAAESIAAARKSTGIAISDVTLYELAWLAVRKRIDAGPSLGSFLAQVAASFIVVPVTAAVAQLAAELPPPYPLDPTDRIIGATALDKGVSLITADRAIARSKAVPVIW